MIAWLQPAALWGLGLLALPLAIHLLRTRHADRIAFPSTQFVRPSRTAAVRLRPPSDLILMALRMGVIALAVLAAAQPLWVSPSRAAQWNGRTARAIVVDTSDSMRIPRSDNRSAAEDADAAAAAEEAAGATFRVGDGDLAQGMRRAAAWLRSAPPAQREIVVISDFQHGSLTAEAVAALDSNMGLRFIAVQGDQRERSVDGVPLLAAGAIAARSQQTRLTPEGTQLRLVGTGNSALPSEHQGLRVLGSDNERDERRLLATLAAAGTPAPDPAQPVAILFAPTPAPPGVNPPTLRWMLETLPRIERDPELARLAREIDAGALGDSESWTVLVRDRRGRPLVRAAALDRELLLQVAVPISSYLAAAATRAVLTSRYGPVVRPEHEILAIPAETLAGWSRSPGPVDESAWRGSDASDARWFWSGALVLLIVEGWYRRRSIVRKDEVRVAA